MSYNLPNPSLAGIILAVSTHNGPQIAFSYPEDLCIRPLSQNDDHANSTDEYDDEDFDTEDLSSGPTQDYGLHGLAGKKMQVWDASHPNYYLGTKYDLMTFLDARELQRQMGEKNQAEKAENMGKGKLGELGELGESGENKRNPTQAKTGLILGFEPEQLSEMLCPPRAMCNRRFDVMLENVVFLGLPIHVDAHGSWRVKKRRNLATGTVTATAKSDRHEPLDNSEPEAQIDSETDFNPPQIPALTLALLNTSGAAMSMFHLVFVMRPPDIERNYRVDEMFYNVTLKLAFVLRREQQKHDYVWTQVRQILKLKEQFRTTEVSGDKASMARYLIQNSPLCKMMAECYSSISSSQIARLHINGKLRAFQIPVKTEFHSLPEPTVPYIPGSCLSSTIACLGSAGLVNIGETSRYSNNNLMELLLGMSGTHTSTATSPEDDEMGDLDDGDGMNANPDDLIHLTLLLWEDPDTIIRDIKAEPHSAIARFVRMLKPTDSLLKIANQMAATTNTLGIALSIAEIKSLALHLVYWRRARIIPPLNTRAIYIVSPMAPIDTNFHRDIVQFNHQFPTVPSLPLFLKLLSTRSRKPRQFASIIPSRDHKDMYLLALAWLVRFGYVTQLHTYIWLKVSKKIKMRVEEELEHELGRAPKPDLRTEKDLTLGVDNTHLPVDNSSKQTGSEIGAGRTSNFSDDAEIDKLQKRLEASRAIPDLVLEDDGDTILVDPGRASSLERKWINKIIHDECKLSPELTAVFYKLLKYMNGKNSLELLLLRENVARGELRKLLLEIDEYIISVRHW